MNTSPTRKLLDDAMAAGLELHATRGMRRDRSVVQLWVVRDRLTRQELATAQSRKDGLAKLRKHLARRVPA